MYWNKGAYFLNLFVKTGTEFARQPVIWYRNLNIESIVRQRLYHVFITVLSDGLSGEI